MNLFCYYPGQCVATEKPYQIAKSLTLAETTVHAYKFLGLDNLGIPFEQCRLIRYNKELFEYSFDAQDMIRPMSDIVGHYFSFDLLMEVGTELIFSFIQLTNTRVVYYCRLFPVM